MVVFSIGLFAILSPIRTAIGHFDNFCQIEHIFQRAAASGNQKQVKSESNQKQMRSIYNLDLPCIHVFIYYLCKFIKANERYCNHVNNVS